MGVDILRGAFVGERTTGGTTSGGGWIDGAASTAIFADDTADFGAGAATTTEATHVGTGCFTEQGFREALVIGA